MGVDVEKPNTYIDDCISRTDPLHKVKPGLSNSHDT